LEVELFISFPKNSKTQQNSRTSIFKVCVAHSSVRVAHSSARASSLCACISLELGGAMHSCQVQRTTCSGACACRVASPSSLETRDGGRRRRVFGVLYVIYIIFISVVSTSIDSESSFPTSKAHVLTQCLLAAATADATRRLAAASTAEGRPGDSFLAADAARELQRYC